MSELVEVGSYFYKVVYWRVVEGMELKGYFVLVLPVAYYESIH